MRTVLSISAAALGIAYLLCGCSHFEDKPLEPERHMVALEARSLDDARLLSFMQGLRPGADLSKGWGLADLTLAAFYNQPELAVAKAQWAVAESEIAGAREYPNPVLDFAPAFNFSTPSDAGVSSWILGTSLDVPVKWSAERRARVAESMSRSRAALLQVVATAWETRGRVRAEMLALHAARQRAVLSLQRADILKACVDQVSHQQQLGGVGMLEVERARQELAETRLAAMDEEAHEAIALARLASALGVPSRALDAITMDFSPFDMLPEDVPADAAWRQALLNRADVLGLLSEYAVAQARLQLEIARQYPDVSIGPGYEFDQSDHKWGLSLSVTLPVLNRNQAAVESARRARDAEAARFEALQARVLGALEEAMVAYTHSLERFHAAAELAQENERSFAIIETRMAAGAVSRIDVLVGKLARNASARRRLDARLDAQTALGRLEDELQTSADLPGWRGMLDEALGANEGTHEKQ